MSDSLNDNDNFQDFDGKNFPILAVLFPDELQRFRAAATRIEMAPNVAVISEGEEASSLYLVQSGLLRVNKRHGNDVFEVGSITPGDLFGEASILYNTRAGAEVRTVEATCLYQVPAAQVRDVLKSNERFMRSMDQLAEHRSAASALAVNPIFATLPQAVREVLLYNGKFNTLETGDTVIREGNTDTRSMFLILGGTAEVSMIHPHDPDKRIVIARLGSGDELGEIPVITGRPHTATVVATSPLRMLVINNDAVRAWRRRYSDFGYALYACVQHKLQHNLEALRKILDRKEAESMTTGTLPPLEKFRADEESHL